MPIKSNKISKFIKRTSSRWYQSYALSRLKPVFKDGTVTAGNASALNDGAAAVALMSLEEANKKFK